MNTKTLITTAIALLSFAAITGAHAAGNAFVAHDAAVNYVAANYTEGSGSEQSPAFKPALTRAQVKATTALARAAGPDLTEGGVQDVAVPLGMAKTRVQVLAELHEAARLGLVPHSGHEPTVATAAQLQRIEMAGLKALQMAVASR